MLNQTLSPGHNACAGCGQLSAVQSVMRALDKNTIIANATGCLEVTTTSYPQTAWGLPWIHSLFENSIAVAAGIRAALNYKNLLAKTDLTNKKIKVIAQGGDGGTFDIGLGLISGSWERGDDILYICYDTEAYSNTGIQASGATPYGASTTTSPAGSTQIKKDMLAIALAHGVKYVAQTTAGFPDDITNKIKKALSINGPAYIQILSPCIPGWKINFSEAVKMGKLAAQTGLYPLLEYRDGKLVSNFKIPKPAPRVAEYLKYQGRFNHLFKLEKFKPTLELIQKQANDNMIKYNLVC